MTAPTADERTGLRERAEFWTSRDPSTVGHLYDRSAVGFAGEVLRLLDALERAEAKVAAVEALADEWQSWSAARSTPRIDTFRDAAEQVIDALDGEQ